MTDLDSKSVRPAIPVGIQASDPFDMNKWGLGIISLAFGSGSIGGIGYLFECRSFGGDVTVATKFLDQVVVGFNDTLELGGECGVPLNKLLVVLCQLWNNVSIGRHCHGEIIQGTGNVKNRVGSMEVGLQSVDALLLL